MKRNLIKLALLSASVLSATYSFADITASTTARWDATAVKDTQSRLVVTPMKSLNFKYAEATQAFNSQTGQFSVAIQGASGATDFTLSSKIINSTLTRTSDTSTLDVGVAWNGTQLTKDSNTVLVKASENISSGLEPLTQPSAYAGTGRTATTGSFDFTIAKATSNGTTVSAFKDLADGTWTGEVAVQFTAVWTIPTT